MSLMSMMSMMSEILTTFSLHSRSWDFDEFHDFDDPPTDRFEVFKKESIFGPLDLLDLFGSLDLWTFWIFGPGLEHLEITRS